MLCVGNGLKGFWREDRPYPSWKLAKMPKAARVKDFILMVWFGVWWKVGRPLLAPAAVFVRLIVSLRRRRLVICFEMPFCSLWFLGASWCGEGAGQALLAGKEHRRRLWRELQIAQSPAV